ncbi:50S ribosomal protein L31 [bacterium]|nr:50S ribosomal protein L31 [bacterium]
MKPDIHPTYRLVNVECACGSHFQTRASRNEAVMKVEICSACHPFFTGQQKLVDTAGRVDKFLKKYQKFARK